MLEAMSGWAERKGCSKDLGVFRIFESFTRISDIVIVKPLI